MQALHAAGREHWVGVAHGNACAEEFEGRKERKVVVVVVVMEWRRGGKERVCAA